MLDLAAIYGRDNSDTVRTIITNVLESDARFVQDFKDAFDMMLTVLKRAFIDARRADQMIQGDYDTKELGKEEQLTVVNVLLQDLIEIVSNFKLITQHFGESTLEQVSNTNFMVYLTNVYCLARKIKKIWLPVFRECNK